MDGHIRTPPPSHLIIFLFSSVTQASFEIHRGCIILMRPLHSISLKKKRTCQFIKMNALTFVFTKFLVFNYYFFGRRVKVPPFSSFNLLAPNLVFFLASSFDNFFNFFISFREMLWQFRRGFRLISHLYGEIHFLVGSISLTSWLVSPSIF